MGLRDFYELSPQQAIHLLGNAICSAIPKGMIPMLN